MEHFPHYRWAKFREWYKPQGKIPKEHSVILLHPLTCHGTHDRSYSNGSVKFLGQLYMQQNCLTTHFVSEFSEFSVQLVPQEVQTDVTLQILDLEHFKGMTNKVSAGHYLNCYQGERFTAEIYTTSDVYSETVITTIPRMVLMDYSDKSIHYCPPYKKSLPVENADSLVFRVVEDNCEEPLFTIKRRSVKC